MEIYKDINSNETKEFANLLNNQTKSKIEEGKIFEATITKISQKYCWVYLDGLKSEPAIDINEIKELDLQDKIKEVRYSKKIEFSEELVKEYFEKKIDLNSKKFDNSLLKEPFFLNN